MSAPPQTLRERIHACQDILSMLPATSIASTRQASAYRVHIAIGTTALTEWKALTSDDAFTLFVNSLGSNVQDTYMRLLYKVTGWLYTQSRFPQTTVADLSALTTALQQVRTQGIRFASMLMIAVETRTEAETGSTETTAETTPFGGSTHGDEPGYGLGFTIRSDGVLDIDDTFMYSVFG